MAVLTEIKGDIFQSIGNDFLFAVDATYKCDVGICADLNKKFDIEKQLIDIGNETNSKWNGKGYSHTFFNGMNTFHALVVKSLPNKIPNLSDIEAAFEDLRNRLLEEKMLITRKIAMPHICCGNFDKMNWADIKDIINNVFSESDNIEFIAYEI